MAGDESKWIRNFLRRRGNTGENSGASARKVFLGFVGVILSAMTLVYVGDRVTHETDHPGTYPAAAESNDPTYNQQVGQIAAQHAGNFADNLCLARSIEEGKEIETITAPVVVVDAAGTQRYAGLMPRPHEQGSPGILDLNSLAVVEGPPTAEYNTGEWLYVSMRNTHSASAQAGATYEAGVFQAVHPNLIMAKGTNLPVLSTPVNEQHSRVLGVVQVYNEPYEKILNDPDFLHSLCNDVHD